MGRSIIRVDSGGLEIQAATFITVNDQKAIIISRNILPQIEIKFIQEKPKRSQMLSIHEPEESDSYIKQWF